MLVLLLHVWIHFATGGGEEDHFKMDRMLVFVEPAAVVLTRSAAELLGKAGMIPSKAEVGAGERNLSI